VLLLELANFHDHVRAGIEQFDDLMIQGIDLLSQWIEGVMWIAGIQSGHRRMFVAMIRRRVKRRPGNILARAFPIYEVVNSTGKAGTPRQGETTNLHESTRIFTNPFKFVQENSRSKHFSSLIREDSCKFVRIRGFLLRRK
jgi:hypothetical protein